MSVNPLISVVIPAYNPGEFIRPALASVVDQTFRDFEVIVVDDGSTEDLSWIESFEPRVRMIRGVNRGLSIARNVGIASATGEFIAFLDADDLWEPAKLQRQVELLDANKSLAMCHTGVVEIDESGRPLGTSAFNDAHNIVDLFSGKCLCVSSVVLRRAVLERVGVFDPALRCVQDQDLWLRIAALSDFGYVVDPLTRYRRHSLSMSRNFKAMCLEAARIYRGWLGKPIVVSNPQYAELIARNLKTSRVGWGAAAFDAARAARKRGNRRDCFRNLCTAAELAPQYTARTMLQFSMDGVLSFVRGRKA